MARSAHVLPGCRLRCAAVEPYMEVPDNQGNPLTSLVRCSACHVVLEHPRPPKQEIDAFYADESLWTDSTDAEGTARSYVNELEQKKPFFRDLARRIERHEEGGRLLDVGAGPGLLQTVLDPARWDVTGVELAPFIARFGRERLGSDVIEGDFLEVQLEGPFDVIVMKYVLDHMEEPAAALERAHELLRPGGLLVLADLINIRSPAARLFAEGFRLIHPMHFTYFSPDTVRLHLDQRGFDTLAVEFPFVRTPYFTAANLALMLRRIARRVVTRARVPSPPMRGSMMDVFARAR